MFETGLQLPILALELRIVSYDYITFQLGTVNRRLKREGKDVNEWT